MNVPKKSYLACDGTHRLIPYRYSDRGMPILNQLAADDPDLLRDLTELEGATNDRLLGESGKLPGITTLELVSGFRLAHVVNAAFTHPRPFGGRFNSAERGAWYAGVETETAQREVVFHRIKELGEIRWRDEEISPYMDYLADFRHEFHDIRADAAFAACLDPENYAASQELGRELLISGSAGVVYPSVRRKGGTCIVCFRPPLVLNVREGQMVTFTFRDAVLTATKTD
jgi:RES domain-containing protein